MRRVELALSDSLSQSEGKKGENTSNLKSLFVEKEAFEKVENFNSVFRVLYSKSWTDCFTTTISINYDRMNSFEIDLLTYNEFGRRWKLWKHLSKTHTELHERCGAICEVCIIFFHENTKYRRCLPTYLSPPIKLK